MHLLRIIVRKLLFRKIETGTTGTHQNSQAFKIFFFEFIQFDSGVFQRFLGSRHTDGHSPRKFL